MVLLHGFLNNTGRMSITPRWVDVNKGSLTDSTHDPDRLRWIYDAKTPEVTAAGAFLISAVEALNFPRSRHVFGM